MSTKTPIREEAVTEHRGRRFRWIWVLALVLAVVAIVAVIAWQLSGDDESTTEGVSAETEQEIIALIDALYAALNESDGQAALDLFTDEGRFVNGRWAGLGLVPLDGLFGEDLKREFDEEGGISMSRTRDPLIVVRDNSRAGRPDSYRVVQTYTHGVSEYEVIHLFNIADVDGTLKFRYVEKWSELGWFRLSEDLPWRGNEGGE